MSMISCNNMCCNNGSQEPFFNKTMLRLTRQGCHKTVSALLLPFLGLLDPQIRLQSSVSGIIWDGKKEHPKRNADKHRLRMKTFPIDGQRQLKDAGQIFSLPPPLEETETVSGVGLEKKRKRGRHSKLMDGIRRGGEGKIPKDGRIDS
ncbi:uncharacterized protein TNCV_1086201 [Trichonephila clavipes]|nr:uncharacterized protein TNCV_1086201 [Trichonephila clavipes]